jgi:histidine kinase/DNA gyrase B/HSP90-like ATPase
MKNTWLEIDREGLRKSLAQKDKFFLLTEMVANAWDANVTRVEVTLTRPENGVTRLTVTDDSATGWSKLSDSYTMFAESTRKDEATKRGRFNAGCKDVLALALEARLTTVTGEMLFNSDGTRTVGTAKRARGSEYTGLFEMTEAEWLSICTQARLFIPPTGIVTIFNGEEIKQRTPVGQFTETLPSVLADKEGMLKRTERLTDVLLYDTLPGEQAMIFEMGVPIVELGDDKWHVNVNQKVPVSRDRDNVNPSYIRKVRVGVLNAKFAELKGEEAATAGWVRDAMGHEKSTDAAVKHVMETRFGLDYVTRSVNDVGSVKEAVSRGKNVIEGGSMSKQEWARVKAIKEEDGSSFLKSSHDVAPTDYDCSIKPNEVIDREDWSDAMTNFAGVVSALAPKMIGKAVTVRYINDPDNLIQGCFQKGVAPGRGRRYKREFGIMTVNLAYHKVTGRKSLADNFDLMLHEFAHNTLYSNDHLAQVFYDTVSELGGKLAVLAVTEPKLFGEDAYIEYITSMQAVTVSANEYAAAIGAAKRK